ncbi:MAG TPA: alpha/beta hydrolase [Mycobacteriales bacterium]|nr:alpha/beta hydrolase [Mycobacteriales bacterium]
MPIFKYFVAVSGTDFAPRNLWRRGRIALDGFRLAYDVAGAGRAMVFLSGGPGHGPGYLVPLADSVTSPGWRMVVFHQRGTGRSPVPPGTGLTVRQAAEDLALLGEHLDTDRMLLVGHGYGASLALLTAALFPDLVGGMVLLCPGPLDEHLAVQAGVRLHARLGEAGCTALRSAEARRDAAAASGDWPAMHAAALEAMRLSAPSYVHDPAARRRWQAELTEEFDHDPCTHAALARSLAEIDQPATARAVRCPVHIVRGELDFQSGDNVEALRESLPGAEVTVVPDAAHLAWLDQPDLVARPVRAAMDRLPF